MGSALDRLLAGSPGEPGQTPGALDRLLARTARRGDLARTLFEPTDLTPRGPLPAGTELDTLIPEAAPPERVAADVTRTGVRRPPPGEPGPSVRGRTAADLAIEPENRRISENLLEASRRRRGLASELDNVLPGVQGEDILRAYEGGVQSASLLGRIMQRAAGFGTVQTPEDRAALLRAQGLAPEGEPLPRAVRAITEPLLGVRTRGDVAGFAGAVGPLGPLFEGASVAARPLATRIAEQAVAGGARRPTALALEGLIAGGGSAGLGVGALAGGETYAKGGSVEDALVQAAVSGVGAAALFGPLGAVGSVARGLPRARFYEDLVTAQEAMGPEGFAREAARRVDEAQPQTPQERARVVAEAAREVADQEHQRRAQARTAREAVPEAEYEILPEEAPPPRAALAPEAPRPPEAPEPGPAAPPVAPEPPSHSPAGSQPEHVQALASQQMEELATAATAPPPPPADGEPAPLTINPESRYASETDSEGLLKGAIDMALARHHAYIQATRAIDKGVSPKKMQQLQGTAEAASRDYYATLGEIRDAFGPEVMGQVHAAIPGMYAQAEAEAAAAPAEQKPEPPPAEAARRPLPSFASTGQEREGQTAPAEEPAEPDIGPPEPSLPAGTSTEEFAAYVKRRLGSVQAFHQASDAAQSDLIKEFNAPAEAKATPATAVPFDAALKDVPNKGPNRPGFDVAETGAPFVTDRNMMVPRELATPQLQKREKNRGGGVGTKGMQQVWDRAIDRGRYPADLRQVVQLTSGNKAHVAILDPRDQSVPPIVVNAGLLRALHRATKFDEIRVSDQREKENRPPIVAYRNGKPVGILMGLSKTHEEMAEEPGATPRLTGQAGATEVAPPSSTQAPAPEEVPHEPVGRDVPSVPEGTRAGATPAAPAEREASAGTPAVRGPRTSERAERPAPPAAPQPPAGSEGLPEPAAGGGPELESGPGARAARPPAHPTPGAGRDYRLTDADQIGTGGPKAKLRANLAAIETLKRLQAEGRATATAEEQAALARYIGWGMFPQPFDPKVKPEWLETRQTLERVLTPEEFSLVRRTILNAHYTSPTVIRGIYDILRRLGVTEGRALEPGMGIGNFLGFRPAELRLQWVGVELDPITGGMAKYLYPEQDIRVQPFEETRLAPNSVDLVIGNVPFAQIVPRDPLLNKEHKLSLHNYFIYKGLRALKPGGLMAVITSAFTMDAQGAGPRKLFADMADLVAAFRLPETAFQKNAGTSVVTDILVFQKRMEHADPYGAAFAGTRVVEVQGGTARINEYFADHPEHVLGTLALRRGQHTAEDLTVLPKPGDLGEQLAAAAATLPDWVHYFPHLPFTTNPRETTGTTELPADWKLGQYRLVDGEVKTATTEGVESVRLPASSVERVKQLMGLAEAAQQLYDAERFDAPETELTAQRKQLNKLYDRFVKKHGPINRVKRTEVTRKGRDEPIVQTRYPNLAYYDDVYGLPTVMALELYDEESDTAKKADIFEHRLLRPAERLERAETGGEALTLSLDAKGRVDLPYMAQLTGRTVAQVRGELAGRIFEEPGTDTWEAADAYLSGNVKAKLAAAQAAAKREPRFQENVRALEAVQPADKAPSQIGVRLGSPWVPPTVYEDFLREVLGRGQAPSWAQVHVEYAATEGLWRVESPYLANQVVATTDLGTGRINAVRLAETAMNQQSPKVYDQIGEGKRALNDQETALAQDKLQLLKEAFEEWVWKDGARAEQLGRLYNDQFNTEVPRRFDGSHLTLQGMASHLGGRPFLLRSHQLDTIWRGITDREHLLAAHVVGSGKTYTAIGIVMERRRLGFSRRAVIAVPGHLPGEWARQFRQMYPSAQILVANDEDMSPKNRARFLAKARAHDWDAIIMKHTQFERVKPSLEAQRRFVREQSELLRAALEEAKAQKAANRSVAKEIEKSLAKMEGRLAELMKPEKVDDLLTFEDLGVDLMVVDEAHAFKNLYFPTKMEGISSPAAQRSEDMFMKTRLLDEAGSKVVFLTATPFSNSLAEVYTMQRYLGYRALQDLGLTHFDAWAATFGDSVGEMEMNITGTGFKMKTRFTRFRNLLQLSALARRFMDVKLIEDLPEVRKARPPLKGGEPTKVVLPPAEGLPLFLQWLKKRFDNRPKGKLEKGWDNALAILNDGKAASIDMRLVDPEATGEGSKLPEVARQVRELYHRYAAHKAAQLIFLDHGINPGSIHTLKSGRDASIPITSGNPGFSAYEELKRLLVAEGIPAREIAFAQSAKTRQAKSALHAAVRAGRIRVLIGSTQAMGEGMNVQERLVASHFVDVPHRPKDVEQADGRILRQGNLLYAQGIISAVEIGRYIMEKSLDAFGWGMIKRKTQAINDFMRGEVDETQDIDDGGVAEAAAAMAAATGDPRVLRQAELDQEIRSLERLRRGYRDQQVRLATEISVVQSRAARQAQTADLVRRDAGKALDTRGEQFAITLDGKEYRKRPEAAEALGARIADLRAEAKATGRIGEDHSLGHFAGFPLTASPTMGFKGLDVLLTLHGAVEHAVLVQGGSPAAGVLQRLENRVHGLGERATELDAEAAADRKRVEELQQRQGQPFPREEEYQAKRQELQQLTQDLAEDAQEEPPASAKEGDGVYLGMGFGAAQGSYERWKAARAAARQPLVISSVPEIEARWQAGKGVKKAGIRAQFRAAMEKLNRARHHFPAINPAAGPLEALGSELLLEVEHGPEYGKAVAYDQLSQIVAGLTEPEVDLVARALALPDIQKDLEAGLYGPEGAERELPFGYTPETLARDIAAAEKAVEANPKVRAALIARQRNHLATTRRLVQLRLLPQAVLDDNRYFHRQVLEYVNAKAFASLATGPGGEVRLHKKGFQRQRVGGGDFNTRYQEAEYEWLAQARTIIHMKETLDRIKRLFDQSADLKGQAKLINRETFRRALGIQPGEQGPDPLLPFRRRIAAATGALYKMLRGGDLQLEGYEGLANALREAWTNRIKDEPFQFSHPQWWSFLSDLLQRGEEGAREAATIFKAIREREKTIKDALGKAYVTPEDLVPEGYRAWQPVKGNYFFPALTIAERMVQAYVNGEREFSPGDLTTQYVLGGPRETWIIPDWLATTMDDFGHRWQSDGLDQAVRAMVGAWKQWILLSPTRWAKYNFNNLSGDIDAALLYPGVMKHAPGAARDVWDYVVRRVASPPLTAEMQELIRLRVIGQGLTAVEIPDINELPGFEKLAAANPLGFMTLVTKYWKHARLLTQARENVLRLAAYRYFLAEIKAGRGTRLYGASMPQAVKALTDPRERGAHLARDLIGDYGDISSAGVFLRDRVFPFFSWKEINAKRYYRIFKNIPLEGGGGGRRARVAGALASRSLLSVLARLLQVGLYANAFFLLTNLWNHLFFPEEERALRRQGRNMHLIIGRRADGSPVSIRIEGAFSDYLEWLNLQDYPDKIRDLLTHEASIEDVAGDMARAPVEEIFSMWEPASKTAFELATGRSTYPSPFRPRPIRDKGEYIAGTLGLAQLYRRVTGKPLPPGSRGFRGMIGELLTYTTDTGEAAYWEIRGKVGDFHEKAGKARDIPNPTARENALYYWRKAVQWGDDAAATKWLREYYRRGGTPQTARQSIQRAAPLAGLTGRERGRFYASLSPRDRDTLQRATQWYNTTLRLGGSRSLSTTPHQRVAP